jgi:hypothetical protein
MFTRLKGWLEHGSPAYSRSTPYQYFLSPAQEILGKVLRKRPTLSHLSGGQGAFTLSARAGMLIYVSNFTLVIYCKNEVYSTSWKILLKELRG